MIGVQAAGCLPGGSGFTIADGIAVKKPGELTMGILSETLDEIVVVEDEQIAQAMVLLAAVDEVGMRICQARQNKAAIGVQHFGPGTDIARDVGGVTYGEDFSGADGDGAGAPASSGETRPHRTASDDEIRFGAAGRDHCENEKEAWIHKRKRYRFRA